MATTGVIDPVRGAHELLTANPSNNTTARRTAAGQQQRAAGNQRPIQGVNFRSDLSFGTKGGQQRKGRDGVAETLAPFAKPNAHSNHTGDSIDSWTLWRGFVYLLIVFTSVLCFTVPAAWISVAFPGQSAAEIGIKALAYYMAAFVAIYAAVPYVGAYLDPWVSTAITFAFLIVGPSRHRDGTKKETLMELGKWLAIILAQAAGSVAGHAVLGIWSATPAGFTWGRPMPGIAVWMPGPPMVIDALCVGFMEGAGTAGITMGAFWVLTQLNDVAGRDRLEAARLMGATYAVSYLLFGAFTGGAFGIYRWLWPSLLSGVWTYPIAYLIGPLAGALVVLLLVIIWSWLAPRAKSGTFMAKDEREEADQVAEADIFYDDINPDDAVYEDDL